MLKLSQVKVADLKVQVPNRCHPVAAAAVAHQRESIPLYIVGGVIAPPVVVNGVVCAGLETVVGLGYQNEGASVPVLVARSAAEYEAVIERLLSRDLGNSYDRRMKDGTVMNFLEYAASLQPEIASGLALLSRPKFVHKPHPFFDK